MATTLTGRIVHLIDDQKFGAIAADDGQQYVFHSMALQQIAFSDLAVGAFVRFEPIHMSKGAPRAARVRLTES